jgi:hypothetical protein
MRGELRACEINASVKPSDQVIPRVFWDQTWCLTIKFTSSELIQSDGRQDQGAISFLVTRFASSVNILICLSRFGSSGNSGDFGLFMPVESPPIDRSFVTSDNCDQNSIPFSCLIARSLLLLFLDLLSSRFLKQFTASAFLWLFPQVRPSQLPLPLSEPLAPSLSSQQPSPSEPGPEIEIPF